jgi:hypothetical protein
MKADEPLDPVHISLLGLPGVVPDSNRPSDVVEELHACMLVRGDTNSGTTAFSLFTRAGAPKTAPAQPIRVI